jgi:hypothetical protein
MGGLTATTFSGSDGAFTNLGVAAIEGYFVVDATDPLF